MKKSLLEYALKNKEFKKVFDYGIEHGFIFYFSEEFIEMMKNIHIDFINCSLYEYFEKGDNIGFCLQACEYLSKMFRNYEIYKGKLPVLSGTKRSENGEHAWLISDGYVYDTSLHIIIKKQFYEYLGYKKEGVVKSNNIRKRNMMRR